MYNRDTERQQYEDWHRYGRERGWFDRASDEVRSWFGDEEAERRRRMDAQMHGSRSGWSRDDREERRHNGHDEDREQMIPEWQRRNYSGPSPRGAELEERGRFGMDYERGRNQARQQHWNYGGGHERGGEYGDDYRYGREGFGMNRDRDMMNRGEMGYGREQSFGGGYGGGMGYQNRESMYGGGMGYRGGSLSERRPQGLGNRFFGGSRDYETGMNWGSQQESGMRGGYGRSWEEEQGWNEQPRGMFGSEHRGGFFGDRQEYRGGERGGLFGGMHRGRGPRNYQRSDERIIDEIHQILTFHPEIDASDIEVLVDKGIVTLRGKVEQRHVKRLAEDLCEDVYGVREVHNELRTENGLFQQRTQNEPRTPGNNLISK